MPPITQRRDKIGPHHSRVSDASPRIGEEPSRGEAIRKLATVVPAGGNHWCEHVMGPSHAPSHPPNPAIGVMPLFRVRGRFGGTERNLVYGGDIRPDALDIRLGHGTTVERREHWHRPRLYWGRGGEHSCTASLARPTAPGDLKSSAALRSAYRVTLPYPLLALWRIHIRDCPFRRKALSDLRVMGGLRPSTFEALFI